MERATNNGNTQPTIVELKYEHMGLEALKNELMGLDISEARKKLGYWWTLDYQDVTSLGGTYVFVRHGRYKITLRTDPKNIVCDIAGN